MYAYKFIWWCIPLSCYTLCYDRLMRSQHKKEEADNKVNGYKKCVYLVKRKIQQKSLGDSKMCGCVKRVCLWVGMIAKSVSKSKWEERKLKGAALKTLQCFYTHSWRQVWVITANQFPAAGPQTAASVWLVQGLQTGCAGAQGVITPLSPRRFLPGNLKKNLTYLQASPSWVLGKEETRGEQVTEPLLLKPAPSFMAWPAN